MKRRFAERDAEAVSATVLDTSIPAISEIEIADSVFGRKPMAIADAEEIVTGAQWGTLMHEAMQWLPVKSIHNNL